VQFTREGRGSVSHRLESQVEGGRNTKVKVTRINGLARVGERGGLGRGNISELLRERGPIEWELTSGRS